MWRMPLAPPITETPVLPHGTNRRSTAWINGMATKYMLLAVMFVFIAAPKLSWAQTPSPLQEWQYISAIPLVRMYENTVADWESVLGAGAEVRPLYAGADAFRVIGGPLFD